MLRARGLGRRAVAAAVATFAAASLAGSAVAAPGDLDTTFSGDGKASTDFTARFDSAWAVAVQPTDGKIVVAGEAAGSGGKFALARYNMDGTLDTTFGGDGRVTTNFTRRYDAAFGVAIQTDGKIVAAGDVGFGGGNSMFGVARYLTSGALDPAFGGGDGKVTTQFTNRDDGVASVVLESGVQKIVVSGGTNFSGSGGNFALARYTPDGSLDPSFGGDGRVTTNFSAGRDYANDVTVQTNGKIVAGGLAFPSGARAAFALARYETDGSLDTTFDFDGRVLTNFTSWHDSVQDLVVQPDQSIVAAGIAGSGGSNARFALARYGTDGALDTTFSTDGKTVTDFTGGFDGSWDVVLQADGKIVATGEAAGSGGRFALARYSMDGMLDTTFGGDGRVTTNFTTRYDAAFGSALDPNGKIVAAGLAAAGGSNPRVAVARYLTN